ncbi:MAG: hypothetical protein WD178_01925 [Actinomycetota bacterium]
MTEEFRGRAEAAAVLLGPIVLMVALFYHPFVSNLTDQSEVAEAMTAGLTRWGLAHIAVGAGFGLLLLSFLAVRSYLRDSGEQRWSALAVPFLVMGTIFSTFLPAMETALVAGVETGADATALQTNLSSWFVPMLITGSALFGIGVVLIAAGVVASRAFNPQRARVIAGVLAVVAVSRFIPQGLALNAGALAALVALAPIAIQMWKAVPGVNSARRPAVARPGTAR